MCVIFYLYSDWKAYSSQSKLDLRSFWEKSTDAAGTDIEIFPCLLMSCETTKRKHRHCWSTIKKSGLGQKFEGLQASSLTHICTWMCVGLSPDTICWKENSQEQHKKGCWHSRRRWFEDVEQQLSETFALCQVSPKWAPHVRRCDVSTAFLRCLSARFFDFTNCGVWRHHVWWVHVSSCGVGGDTTSNLSGKFAGNAFDGRREQASQRGRFPGLRRLCTCDDVSTADSQRRQTPVRISAPSSAAGINCNLWLQPITLWLSQANIYLNCLSKYIL